MFDRPPHLMKAAQLSALEGPSVLRVADVPVPSDTGRVLIEVRAAGVSYPDLLMTYGKYQKQVPAPFVPGIEIAGVVAAAPTGSAVSVGDDVVAFSADQGGYAEFVTVDPSAVAPKPPELDFGQAAALMANFQTTHFALTRRSQVRQGQTVLVLGAAGGVGTAGIQVAHALGARVIAVVHRSGTEELLRTLGADHVVALADGWATQVRELTNGVGVDVVLDPIGGVAFDDAVRTLASEGQLLVIGFAAGGIPSVKVNRLLMRNASVVGVAWGEYVRSNPTVFRESVDSLAKLIADGLRPHITARYPLDGAAAALAALERGEIVAKAVLDLS